MFRILYLTYVRSQLKYSIQAIDPCFTEDANTFGCVHRAVTKLRTSISKLPYDELVKSVNPLALFYCRTPGDLVLAARTLNNILDVNMSCRFLSSLN